MRILVTGGAGQLAMALAEKARLTKETVLYSIGRPELDLENAAATQSHIVATRPDLIVNAAAYTAVDKAESEPDRAFAVNRDGAAAVARAAAELRVPLIHLSTDYVFDGRKPEPYIESDATGPLNVYGQSKLAGEIAVRAEHASAVILRTSWVVSPFGNNFVRTMLRLGAERPLLRVVDDQHGCPTSALDLADAILRIAPLLTADQDCGGTYHICGNGSTTWHGLARFIFSHRTNQTGHTPVIESIPSKDYPTPATRPTNSRLDTSAFANRFGFRPRRWEESVAEIVARYEANEVKR